MRSYHPGPRTALVSSPARTSHDVGSPRSFFCRARGGSWPRTEFTDAKRRSWAPGCRHLSHYWFALLLNTYHERFCKLVARVTTVVRNAWQDMADLSCFD